MEDKENKKIIFTTIIDGKVSSITEFNIAEEGLLIF